MILHWNGTAWTRVPSPSPGNDGSVLTGVRVMSANNAWAVGAFINLGGTEKTLILHWNGTPDPRRPARPPRPAAP